MKHLLPLIGLTFLTACTTNTLNEGWNISLHHDDFTDRSICRVEKGSKAARDFTRAFKGVYFTQHFYAENNDGEIRAGVRTEPPLPIGGDIQIKVGPKLYTLTSKDTPLDVAPTIDVNTDIAAQSMGQAYADSLKAMTTDIQKFSSPYRAYTGQKAKALIKDIVANGGEIKFRTIGVNTATSETGAFTAGEDFTAALSECGIRL